VPLGQQRCEVHGPRLPETREVGLTDEERDDWRTATAIMANAADRFRTELRAAERQLRAADALARACEPWRDKHGIGDALREYRKARGR
jgi:hypothetical protein